MGFLSQEIRRLREANGFTVRGLAERLGKSPGYISRVEVRGEIPSPEFLCELSAVLKVDAEHLLDLALKSQLQKQDAELRAKHQKVLALYRKEKRQ